jgi:hypothetical protein
LDGNPKILINNKKEKAKGSLEKKEAKKGVR